MRPTSECEHNCCAQLRNVSTTRATIKFKVYVSFLNSIYVMQRIQISTSPVWSKNFHQNLITNSVYVGTARGKKKSRISCLNSDSNGLDMSSDHYSSIMLSLDVEEKTNGNITKIFYHAYLVGHFTYM